ncbi:thiopeptide maturation pyridine synthase [Saccharothrix texasensis]|uniref:Lantibiotic biosynthesis dehydratase-like protein n=1 Tax=Saccharothrix texasensis TaxID=103734 RepID=A0A3N1H056_9PSEU|nr:thiopeptide maturation pyridine synthase [Saccharothrix texasensis]ROP35933.1 lantibiotic biosynthesis dehydratase-like protein [Saccharothrix texasensis]
MTVETEQARRDTLTTWHSLHVHYHDPDQDRLILDAVRPVFQHLRSRVAGLYLARHWRQGPHLRLFAKTDPDTWARVVRPRIEAVVGEYLARHPSTTQPDFEHDLAQHRLLARREQERGPLLPWFPDNSVHEQPYDTRPHVIRSPQTGELMASFASESTNLLFRMLDRARAGVDAKELMALELVLATAVAAGPPGTSGFASYRSHAEGFLCSCADPDAVRAAFDAHYESHRGALISRTRAVLATLGGGASTTPYARRWAARCEDYGRRVGPLIERDLVFPPAPAEAPAAPPADRPATRPAAPLHALMLGSRAYREAVLRHPDFLRYRFLLTCTHLQISRLGLTPFQRFRTCHAAANAVEEIHGVSAADAIRAYGDGHPDPVA